MYLKKPVVSACDEGWLEQIVGNKHFCFKDFGVKSHFTAIETCKNAAAFLPVPENESQNFEYYWAFHNVAGTGYKWLGIHDADEEGVFVNVNVGEPGIENKPFKFYTIVEQN